MVVVVLTLLEATAVGVVVVDVVGDAVVDVIVGELLITLCLVVVNKCSFEAPESSTKKVLYHMAVWQQNLDFIIFNQSLLICLHQLRNCSK